MGESQVRAQVSTRRRVAVALLLGAFALLAPACGSRMHDGVFPVSNASGGMAPVVMADQPDSRGPADDQESVVDHEPDDDWSDAQTHYPADPEFDDLDAEWPDCDWDANLAWATIGRDAEWIIAETGAWGRAEVPGERIWIAPRTPCERVYSVAVHEWTHHMQGVVYGDWGAVVRELAPYGGAEAVADCGALILGATWLHYGCPDQGAKDAADAILRGERP